MAKVIVVDASKCYACLGCVVECAYQRSGAGEHVSLTSGVLLSAVCEVIAVGADPVPLMCNHCADAPCLTVCPTEAIHRQSPEGPVMLMRELCIGCKACVMACPFGMVHMGREGTTAVKCDMCSDRLAVGRQPACVEACITGALEVRELEDVVSESQARAGAMVLAGGVHK